MRKQNPALAAVVSALVMLIVSACVAVTPTPAPPAENPNKAVVRRVVDEVWNAGNLDAVDELYAADYIDHTPLPGQAQGIEGVRETVTAFRSAFPDMELTVEDMVAEGDTVVTRFTATATHQAEFAGIAPTGNSVEVGGILISRLADGKIAEEWENFDELGLLTQLGAIPSMQEAEAEAAGGPRTVATGLNAPMDVVVAPDGRVFAIDSGTGGDTEIPFVNPDTGEATTATVGDTARVVQVSPDGTESVVVTLPSILVGEESVGGAGLALLDGNLYATNGAWIGGTGDAIPNTGAVLEIEMGQATEVAQTWLVEQAQNPDGYVLEDHPYHLTAGPDGNLWVANAGANTLLKVDPASGDVEVVAVFEGLPSPLPNPNRGGAQESDPVPTGVAFGPDGSIYVSLLPGFPFLPGSAKVVQVTPDGEVTDYATGLTMLTDLAAGPDGNLYAVQIGVFSEQGPVLNSGQIIRVQAGGASESVVDGLSFPTGIDFNADGDAYVTTNGVGAPGSGEVMVFPGLTAMEGTPLPPVEAPPAPQEESAQPGAAPVPATAQGPAIPQDKGYLVEEISDGLYWVTEGTYQAMFLTTGEGVIVVDAPPSIGANMLAAIAEVTDEPITHVIYSHAHADHIGAAGMYPADATYIAHEATAVQLAEAEANNPDRMPPFGAFLGGGPVPLPTETFTDRYTLTVGDQTLELVYGGINHDAGNIFIYAPKQKVLMLVDVVFPGWVPFKSLALANDIRGYIQAYDQALVFDFDTFIGGHLTRLGTREDVEIGRQYLTDVESAATDALQSVDFMAIAQQTGFANLWLLFDTYLDAVAQACTDQVVPQWTGRLGGVDVFTFDHCSAMVEGLRIE